MSNTSKPAREWADHFPEPIRSQFLANCDNVDCLRDPDHMAYNLAEAIAWAFWWGATKDGIDWANIHRMAVNGEFNNPTEPITEPVIVWRDLTADEWYKMETDCGTKFRGSWVNEMNEYMRKLLTQ